MRKLFYLICAGSLALIVASCGQGDRTADSVVNHSDDSLRMADSVRVADSIAKEAQVKLQADSLEKVNQDSIAETDKLQKQLDGLIAECNACYSKAQKCYASGNGNGIAALNNKSISIVKRYKKIESKLTREQKKKFEKALSRFQGLIMG